MFGSHSYVMYNYAKWLYESSYSIMMIITSITKYMHISYNKINKEEGCLVFHQAS